MDYIVQNLLKYQHIIYMIIEINAYYITNQKWIMQIECPNTYIFIGIRRHTPNIEEATWEFLTDFI